jgi:hypothetical protein
VEAKTRRASRPRRSSFGGRGLPYGGGMFDGGMFDGGMTSPPVSPASTAQAEAEAEKIVRLLSERATAARAETVWATSTVQIPGAPAPAATPAGTVAAMVGPTGWLEPLKSTWSRKALAAILIPALILLIVCLV